MRASLALWLLLLVMVTACADVRPDHQLGPVIDASQNVSVADYNLVGSIRTVFIRHFYYFSRPTQWTILSSGDGRPVTLFEETSVYALRQLETRNTVTRLGVIPGIRTDGIRPPRVHLALGFTSLSRIGRVAQYPSAIVYVEDGPIYGSLDAGGDLDPRTTGDQPLRLLVDARVRAAALAADGVTIAYADDSGRVFRFDGSATEPTLLGDVRARFGQVSISAMQWEGHVEQGALRLERVLIRLEHGSGEELWAVGMFEPLHPASIPPEMVPKPDSDQHLEALNRMTQEIGPDEWRVPDPHSFSP